MSIPEHWSKKLADRRYNNGDRIIGLFSAIEGTVCGVEPPSSNFTIRYTIKWDNGHQSNVAPHDFTTKDDPFFHIIQSHKGKARLMNFCALSVGKDENGRLRVIYHHSNKYSTIAREHPNVCFKWTWHLNEYCAVCVLQSKSG